MKGYTQICHELQRQGVTDVFGLAGDGNYRYLSLLPTVGIAFHGARHENSAISMADGYARASGKIGVCTVTHGPGLTHAVSALVEARKGHSEILFLASDTPTWPTAYSCQDLDQVAVLTAIGLRAERVRTVGTLARDLARAFAAVEHFGEPMALLVPTDIQDGECAYSPTTVRVAAGAETPAVEVVAEIAEWISAANCPLLLAGRGARSAASVESLERLASEADMLLGTTALAHGLFAGNPFSVGVVGGFANDARRELIAEADLIVGFGASFSTWTSLAGRSFAPSARLLQIDRDPAAIGAHAPIALGVIADVRATADAVAAHMAGTSPARSRPHRTSAMAERINGSAVAPFEDRSDAEHVDPRAVLDWFDTELPRARTICIDGGWHGKLPIQRLSSADVHSFVFSQAYQSIGLGIGTAIGAAVARPERLAVLVVGDGGLSMSMTELVTAANCGHPVLVIVINDSAYLAEVEGLTWLGLPSGIARLVEVDFAAVAAAVNGRSVVVRAMDDLHGVRSWIDSPKGLMLVDCRVPCPMDYGRAGAGEWIEHIWHSVRSIEHDGEGGIRLER